MIKVKDLALFAILSNAFLFEAMFRYPKKTWDQDTYDCALVCGYPANPDGSISKITKSRTDTGIRLYKEGKVKKLLFSGGPVHNEHTEALVMKAYAMEAGIPEKDILTEEKAGSTYGNMKNSAPILRKNRIKSLVVITNDWHLRKADHYARKLHIPYVCLDADKPEGETTFANLMLRLQTHATSYYNMWQGLY